jgi:FlaA1/EpsC-like NDP-sugar epimerase
MLKRYQASTGPLMRLLDATVISACWIAAYYIRFYMPFVEVTKGFPSFQTYLDLTPIIAILWAALFQFFEVYSSSKLLRRTAEAQLVLKAHFLTLLIFIALTYFLSEYRYSRVVLISFGVLSAVALILIRIIFRSTLRRARRIGFRTRRVLLVGEGKSLN